ncbi:septum formation initiator family protein [Candidatus Berkelbacteria bacterium]|nr:septum formation initiator family protein [Candidatus Berkelbacteria bacterium]
MARIQARLGLIVIRTLAVLMLSYVFINLGRAIQKNYSISEQIRQLKEDIETLEYRLAYLKNQIFYYQSTAYRELEARRRLGLKRPGETVVLIAKNRDNQSQTTEFPVVAKDTQTDTAKGFFDKASSNAQTWINWLLHRRSKS